MKIHSNMTKTELVELILKLTDKVSELQRQVENTVKLKHEAEKWRDKYYEVISRTGFKGYSNKQTYLFSLILSDKVTTISQAKKAWKAYKSKFEAMALDCNQELYNFITEFFNDNIINFKEILDKRRTESLLGGEKNVNTNGG